MAFSLWSGFFLAAILIAISPGPGAATSMSAGLRYGYGHALRVILGLQAALMIQLAIVAAGLGALLATSALAFDTLRIIGAAYLIWLGVQKWRTEIQIAGDDHSLALQNNLFLQGLLVNLTNPKAIIFMVALMPQFVDPERPQGLQFLIIGLTMCSVDTVVMSGYALLASRLRRWLSDPASQLAQNRFFGGLFIGAGALLAVSRQS